MLDRNVSVRTRDQPSRLGRPCGHSARNSRNGKAALMRQPKLFFNDNDDG